MSLSDFIPFFGGNSGRSGANTDFALRLVRQLTMPTFVLDAEGKVMIWNEAMEVLTGVKETVVIGTRNHWRGFYASQRPCLADLVFGAQGDRGKLYENVGNAERGKALRAENWVDLSGHKRYVVIDAGPILDHDGNILGVVETIRDITEQKQAQAELDRLHHEQLDSFNEIITQLGAAIDRLAHGDLSVRVERPLPGVDKLRVDFNLAVESLARTIAAISKTSQIIRVRGDEIAHSADALAQRTETQAAGLEQSSAAMAQITVTVRKTAECAAQAQTVARNASVEARERGSVVKQAVNSMSEIENFSQQISQIVGVIDEIAFQTNLLALNAGVEAARAGESGRGFAVVAAEVRALAMRSADAAKEIKSLITSSSEQIKDGVMQVAQCGEVLDKLVTEISGISQAIDEINVGAREQSTSLLEVNTAIAQMDEIAQQNASMADEAMAASRSLVQENQNLDKMLSTIHTGSVEERAESRGRRAA